MPAMDLDFVQKLIELVARSPIDELEVERDGVRVRISRHASATSSTPQPGPSAQPQPISVGEVATGSAPTVSKSARHSIRAPLTGVFYRAAAEGEPPFASVGDVVEEGQKIGVLEAMKTFNVVESDRTGRIVEIAFADHAAVQSGDVLFILEQAG